MSEKTAFLLAVASTKRRSELHALSVGEGFLRMAPDNSGGTLRPNPAFLPKVLPADHVVRPWSLAAFSPSGEGLAAVLPNPLCPVRALGVYVSRTKAVRQTDQLFVCYGQAVRGRRLSQHRLSHWIVDAIQAAYQLAGRPLPGPVVAHSTRGMAASWAQVRGVPLADVCAAAGWASPLTFARFYRVNVVPPNVLQQAVLGVGPSSLEAEEDAGSSRPRQ